MSLISEYLIMPRYIGKKNTHIAYIIKLIYTAGRNFITPGRSTNKCLTNKKENKKEIVIRAKSQQNMIQRGAYLFLKNRSNIKD